MQHVTQILSRVEQGDAESAEQLLGVVYAELRKLAAAKLSEEPSGQTLQATDLVHEAWLKLVDVDYVQHWSSRRHFFSAAAEAMRRILVDRARRRNRQKHGGDWQRIRIDLASVSAVEEDQLLVEIHEALQKFAHVDATACELVKLKYFAGLSLHDAAQTLEIAPRTADRLWAYAKAWLFREIKLRTNDT